jgi:hypothetical protein
MSDMSDYWDDDSAYDTMAGELKMALQQSVKVDIKALIAKLEAENSELRNKLVNLTELERAATIAKATYDREFSMARREALQAVRREKLVDVLSALDERLYTVDAKYEQGEKCEKCDVDRKLRYKTPRGNDTYEMCECSNTERRVFVAEVAAHEVASRDGQLVIWWAAVSRWKDSDSLNARVLRRAESVTFEQRVASPGEFSYKDTASAQLVADAVNAATTGKKATF